MSVESLRGRNFASVREVAEFLGDGEPLDERTVRRAIEQGQIPAVKVGTKTLVPVAPLLAMIQAPDTAPAEAPPAPAVDAVSAAREILRGALRALDALSGYHERDHGAPSEGSAAGQSAPVGGLDVLPLRPNGGPGAA